MESRIDPLPRRIPMLGTKVDKPIRFAEYPVSHKCSMQRKLGTSCIRSICNEEDRFTLDEPITMAQIFPLPDRIISLKSQDGWKLRHSACRDENGSFVVSPSWRMRPPNSIMNEFKLPRPVHGRDRTLQLEESLTVNNQCCWSSSCKQTLWTLVDF